MEGSVKKRISQHGVTLVELLIVIAILTIIAGIGMYGFRETRLKANLREGARILSGDLMAARTAARTRGEAVTVALAINDRSYLCRRKRRQCIYHRCGAA
jgi:prepilin-type N-terminal cleavage/methylation domain-containing protein